MEHLYGKGKKTNKEKSFIETIALLDSRQTLISMGSFSRDWGLYVISTGPLKGHSDAVCAYPASASLQVSLGMLIKITTLQETSSAETLLQYIWLTKKASFIWKIAPGTPDHLCSMEQEGHDLRVKTASSENSRAHATSQLLKPNKKSGRITVESIWCQPSSTGKDVVCFSSPAPQLLSCNSSDFFGEILTRVQFC